MTVFLRLLLHRWVVLSLLQPTLCEFGLLAHSHNAELDGGPVRLIDGKMVIGGSGPLLQYFFNDQKIVLSPKLLSKDAEGTGVAVSSQYDIVLALSPRRGFRDMGGWLDHNFSPVFRAYQTDSGWQLSTDTDLVREGFPVMLEVALIAYHTKNVHLQTISQAERLKGKHGSTKIYFEGLGPSRFVVKGCDNEVSLMMSPEPVSAVKVTESDGPRGSPLTNILGPESEIEYAKSDIDRNEALRVAKVRPWDESEREGFMGLADLLKGPEK